MFPLLAIERAKVVNFWLGHLRLPCFGVPGQAAARAEVEAIGIR